MPLFEIDNDRLTELQGERFADLNLYEREDLQRFLRNDVTPLGDDLLVIAEEYSEWEEARRRIDLLAIDTAGRLVVIELKRTEAGGHMDLQAIRYAAMVSSMTYEDVVKTYEAFCARHQPDEALEAREQLEQFLLGDGDDDEPTISTHVRIILVSADFGREITTTLLWLNSYDGMDIRCVRLVPYDLNGRVVLDVQQVIPLPEAADYQVKVRQKEAARERARTKGDGRDLTKYHIIVDGEELPAEAKRQAIRSMIENLARKGVPLENIHRLLPDRAMKRLPGRLEDPADVKRELLKVVSSPDQVRRHFTESPLIDEEDGATYVIYKMWGKNTEPALEAMASAFPDTQVRFRAAEE